VEERNGNVHLVFHETKHFGNPELRTSKEEASVLEQIKRYASALKVHQRQLQAEYAAVCRSLLVIDGMRQAVLAKSGDRP
jgi:hypothetical protein